MNYLIILKAYFLNWILGQLNGYFLEVTTFLQKLYVLFWSAWQCFKFSSYNRIVSAGDFNTEEKETFMKTFLYQYDFKNLVKNSSKPTTINLFLTNDSTYFQKTKIIFTVFTGISDYHKQTSKLLQC